jgi:hypothetical protein
MAPEPEGSSPHSQQPANGPYPEPSESTPHTPPTNLSKVHFDPILPSTPWSFRWSFPFVFRQQSHMSKKLRGSEADIIDCRQLESRNGVCHRKLLTREHTQARSSTFLETPYFDGPMQCFTPGPERY